MSQSSFHASAATELLRDDYGALAAHRLLTPEQCGQLAALISSAVKAGHLPAPYIESTKRELNCLNLDEYDVLLSRKRVVGAVIQVRSFWKDVRKGYTRGQKSYFLVTKAGRKVEVREVDKATCVRRAKNATALGQLVKHYLGMAPLACKAAEVTTATAFKILAQDDDGTLRSVYDDSVYVPGKWRSEAARPGHEGGFYFYRQKDEALRAWRQSEVFHSARTDGKRLVLGEVEVAGREVEYPGGKVAASRLRVGAVCPIEESQVQRSNG